MDPVTHITSGLIAAQAVRTPRWAFPGRPLAVRLRRGRAGLPTSTTWPPPSGPKSYTACTADSHTPSWAPRSCPRLRGPGPLAQEGLSFRARSFFSPSGSGPASLPRRITTTARGSCSPSRTPAWACPLSTSSILLHRQTARVLLPFLLHPHAAGHVPLFGLVWIVLYPLTNWPAVRRDRGLPGQTHRRRHPGRPPSSPTRSPRCT
jgi:hypothetical protein